MNRSKTNTRSTLDQLIRRQRSRLTAQLVKHYGYELLPLVEDAIQDALLKALEKWEYDGIPDNAGAWLYKVAYNRAIDLLRKSAPEVCYEETMDNRSLPNDQDDAELKMLLYCCESRLKPVEQQLLMLNLVIGLDYSELGLLTLSSKDAIAQRMARLKRKTRQDSKIQPELNLDWDAATINSVLSAIYTAFNVGYFPRQGDSLIRRDVAMEALRLGHALIRQCPKHSNHLGSLHALTALMSFQCSRLDARENFKGEPILLHEQNSELWDRTLIREGTKLLEDAKQLSGFSEFHIEAAIAALHTQENREPDWQVVSELYDSLLAMATSPGRVIGAAIARCANNEYQAALDLLNTLERETDVSNYTPFHLAKSEVLSKLGRKSEADQALDQAKHTASSAPITVLIENKII